MRPQPLFRWFSSVEHLKGVGDVILGHLRRLLRSPEGELPRFKDLAFHLPVEVLDRRNQNLQQGAVVTLLVMVERHEAPAGSRRAVPYRVMCKTAQSVMITLTFFHSKGDYLLKQLPIGQERVISGRVENTGYGWQMAHPDAIGMPQEYQEIARLEPIYPLTAGLMQRKLAVLIQQVLKLLTPLPEWQDAHWLKQQQWVSLQESLHHLHHPEKREDLLATSPYFQRIAFDELVASQLALALIRERIKRRSLQWQIDTEAAMALRAALLEMLPFQLTEGQQAVLAQIDADMQEGGRMLRLLQGDVGSGKTVIALLTVLSAVASGVQAAIMVPTEILARQHLAFMQPLLEKLGIAAVMLSGNTPALERQRILAGLQQGTIPVVIGTHALFQDSVVFKQLGVAVIDEQHRFGVQQRLTLAEKGINTHILLMTATPIPRSLTLTLFGDMDISRLTEKPKGRQPITTRSTPLTRIEEVLQAMERALQTGSKIYWICPLVEGAEEDAALIPREREEREEIAAATLRHAEFTARYGHQVGLLHGRMKGEEREAVMARFASGEDRLLVATTVVEVGVDVPDATIMVIEHAERFGLAQLHQLRGRVGRGAIPSSCLLLYGEKLSAVAKDRLRILRESNDGFLIAEEDLRLRGSGEILGLKQSGMPEFHFADIGRDANLLQVARDECKLILHRDPELASERGKALRCLLYLFEQDKNVKLLGSG
jgi:ATP-dependent DNA helicase RecG